MIVVLNKSRNPASCTVCLKTYENPDTFSQEIDIDKDYFWVCSTCGTPLVEIQIGFKWSTSEPKLEKMIQTDEMIDEALSDLSKNDEEDGFGPSIG